MATPKVGAILELDTSNAKKQLKSLEKSSVDVSLQIKNLNTLKQLLNKPIFKEALSGIKLSKCHGLRMLPVILLKMHAYRLSSILFIVRAKQNEKQVED